MKSLSGPRGKYLYKGERIYDLPKWLAQQPCFECGAKLDCPPIAGPLQEDQTKLHVSNLCEHCLPPKGVWPALFKRWRLFMLEKLVSAAIKLPAREVCCGNV
jgi:hypothetical protein